MARFQLVWAATSLGSSKATCDTYKWMTITHGNQFLAAEQETYGTEQMFEGAAIFLADSDCEHTYHQHHCAFSSKWFLNFNTSDPSQPFDIRVGEQHWGSMNHGTVSNWCIDAHDLNSRSAALSIQMCNGLPQQQFTMDNKTEITRFLGGISLVSGKRMDASTPNAAGRVPTAQAGDLGAAQLWGICQTFDGCKATDITTTCAHLSTPTSTGEPQHVRTIDSLQHAAAVV